MTTAADVLRIAAAEVGTKESPLGSNRQKYGEWYGMNGVAWCAEFVSWVFDRAGLRLPAQTAKGFSYCGFGVNYFKGRNAWSSRPLPGDVFFCGRLGQDHTGIVEAVDADGLGFTTIEGNSDPGGSYNGTEVCRRHRRVGDGRVFGFGRPAYSQGVQPMFNPAITLEPVVAELPCPTGGVWLLAASGAVYAFGGAPYKGGANGQAYFVGRKAARLEPGRDGHLYTIVATSNERYDY